jgi:hypothetical protein
MSLPQGLTCSAVHHPRDKRTVATGSEVHGAPLRTRAQHEAPDVRDGWEPTVRRHRTHSLNPFGSQQALDEIHQRAECDHTAQ